MDIQRASWRIAVVRPPENSLPMEVPLECLSHPFKASRVASIKTETPGGFIES